MKTSIISGFIFTALLTLTGCQLEKIDPVAPVNTFEKIFNGGFPSKPLSMCLQNNGNIGVICNENTGSYYAPAIFMLDGLTGSVTWKKSLSLGLSGAILPSDVGGYYVSFGKPFYLGIAEINEGGNILHTSKTTDFPFGVSVANEYLTQILQDSSSSKYIVCGNTDGNTSLHIVLFNRFNNSPALTFTATTEIANTRGHCIQKTIDGGFIVCGKTSSNIRLVKLDANRGVLWNKADFNTGQMDEPWVVQTSDGGYLIVTYDYLEGKGSLLIKTDKDGEKKWSKYLIPGQGNGSSFVLPTQDNDYLICGSKDSKGYAAKIKVDNDGPTIIWEKSYNNATQLTQAIETDDNGFLMIGALSPTGIYLTKTDQNGNIY